ncbi:MAG TPA: deoxyhypusine synthase [Thermoplasmatales archaeon]|nr:deoxyhypusine synthase [Thermoplasmatales archaeon]
MPRIVEDIKIKEDMRISQLISYFSKTGGFTAKKISDGIEILEEMIKDKDCKNFLSFPACICATGTRGVIVELLKRRFFDVVITTTGTLDHDLARLWKPYYHGTFMADDIELHKQGINRLGNIFIPNESYGIILEEKLQPFLEEIGKEKKRWSTRELTWAMGEYLVSKLGNREESIIYWVWRNKIPIYIPGVTDGAVGSQLWMYYQEHRDFTIDLLKDEQELADLVFSTEKTGALMIGGGISKHHTIWWNQFKDGLDYAVYITTAMEYDGSLSGARTREAISWGKMKEKAEHITIEGDATVILPLIAAALVDKLRV